MPLTAAPFSIEVESEERRTVRTLRIVGPDGVGGSTSYEDEDDAQNEYDALMRGYRYGVESQAATLSTRTSELLDERLSHEATRANLAEAEARCAALVEALEAWQRWRPDCAQLLDGWRADGTPWTAWDSLVRERLTQLDALTLAALTAAQDTKGGAA